MSSAASTVGGEAAAARVLAPVPVVHQDSSWELLRIRPKDYLRLVLEQRIPVVRRGRLRVATMAAVLRVLEERAVAVPGAAEPVSDVEANLARRYGLREVAGVAKAATGAGSADCRRARPSRRNAP